MGKRTQLFLSQKTNTDPAWSEEGCWLLPLWDFMKLQLGEGSRCSYLAGNVLTASKMLGVAVSPFVNSALEFSLRGYDGVVNAPV